MLIISYSLQKRTSLIPFSLKITTQRIYYACHSFCKIQKGRIVKVVTKEKVKDYQWSKIIMQLDVLNVKDTNVWDQMENTAYYTLKGDKKKNQINLNYRSIECLMDLIRSQSGNKKFSWKIITSDVFNLKIKRLTIRHIICVKTFWQRRHKQYQQSLE